jgi:RNA-directed DNA polymerase
MSQSGSKPYEISKWEFVAAFNRVKANKGGPGVDGVTVEQFGQDVKNNLYKLWNRMSSGSYFPSPVRMVSIPKGQGTRILGVPTVADRVAQTVAVAYLEPLVEPVFHADSYGYRPGRSPHDAVAVCRDRCRRYDWVLEVDIEGFFDNLDHDLVEDAVARFTDAPWVLLYVRRWLKAPLQRSDGTVVSRDRGSPQGAAISPLLANLFMHLAFDEWMAREFPDVPFERYVDDVIVHCVTQAQARRMKDAIGERLGRCGGLRLHPTKTRIVYCKMSGRNGPFEPVTFDFLGFTFKPRRAKSKDGTLFTSFSPAISGEAATEIRQEIRRMRLHLRTDLSFADLAERINPKARGWANYYGAFGPGVTANVLYTIDTYLIRWARRKYKHLRRAPARAYQTLQAIKRSRPGLLAHWRWAVLRRAAAARTG